MQRPSALLPLFVCLLTSGLWWRGEPATTPGSAWAQTERGLPFVTAFEIPPTRHNGEVWVLAPAPDGRLWIGSDELYLFDGHTHERVELPFETYAVRALAHDDDGTLWVGAIGEIGRVERTASGGWRYVSARDALRAAGVENLRDVWRAHRTRRGVVFVADQQVLRWNGSAFEHWDLPSAPNLLSSADADTLWIYQSGVGLLRMEDEGPRLTLPAAELPGPVVFWALSARERPEDASALLVGTVDGIFARHAAGWRKLSAVSAAVGDQLPLHATMLGPETFAIGCYLGGIVLGTTDDTLLARINRANGLSHDTITGLWHDENHTLWAGHPGGMSRIEARGAVTVFDARNGLSDAPVLKALSHGEATYLLSRRALVRLAPGHPGDAATVAQIANLPSPLSDAVERSGVLWFSSYGGGIWQLTDGTPREILPLTGYIFGLLGERIAPHTLLLLHNTQVEALASDRPGTWSTHNLAAELGSYPVNVVRGRDRDVWVSTVTRGIMRFRLEPDGAPTSLHLEQLFTAGAGMPGPLERPRLTTVGGRVFVFSERTVLGHAEPTGTFQPEPGFESFVPIAGTPSDDPAIAYWLLRFAESTPSPDSPPALVRVRVQEPNGALAWEPLEVPDLVPAGRISALHFTATPEAALWVAGSQTLVRLSVAHLTAPALPPALTLRTIARNGTAITLPHASEVLPFAADTTRLRIELAGAVRASGQALLVQAALGGISDEWQKPVAEPAFDFTGLRPGRYTFRARAVDEFGRTGPVTIVAFMIAAPWYLRAPAIVSYALGAMLLILTGVRWRLRRLQHLNERLNRLVDDRTHELARANMVKNEFLENISHEIRNPLNGIANLVDLLRDAPLRPEERRLAQSLGRSTEHLKRVFADVLGYTRLEYGHVQLELAPFSLAQLLEDIVGLFGIEAREQRCELTLRLPSDFADGFRGDAEKIRAIVSNYVSNALKYAPGAPVELEVSCTLTDAPVLTRVWIGVRDHGPGLPADEQAGLFRKFSRGARAKAAGIRGTGLGLATCRGLAELMDGTAGVSSEEGQGATFWVELPLARAIVPAALPPPDSPADRVAAHALVVDDQEYNQVVLRGIARRLGYEPAVASHAGEVWPLIEQRVYATVFLDWELPGLNGGEIARKLREHANTRDAVIIATTAHDNDEIRQQCVEARMDGYALKPFDTARIQKVVDLARARRAGHAASSPALEPSEAALIRSANPQLSLGAFTDFAAGDPARAQHAVALYLQALDEELAELRAAIARDDRETVARRAHRLRSHAGLVNATALNAAAQGLVRATRDPSVPDWRPLCPAVFTEAAALRAAITSLQANPTAGG